VITRLGKQVIKTTRPMYQADLLSLHLLGKAEVNLACVEKLAGDQINLKKPENLKSTSAS